jgi:hypothetical protein
MAFLLAVTIQSSVGPSLADVPLRDEKPRRGDKRQPAVFWRSIIHL